MRWRTLAEALDRVSRDEADVATPFRHLRFAGVQVVTLSEGEIGQLHVGLKGTMNALFLKDLAAETHRHPRSGSRRASPAAASATAMTWRSTPTPMANQSAARAQSTRRRPSRPPSAPSPPASATRCGRGIGAAVERAYGNFCLPWMTRRISTRSIPTR